MYTQGSADCYSIDSKDNVVAIVEARPFDDWAMWKSTDNGATWTKTIIMTFPVRKYDFKSDTLTRTICAGDAVHVLIDNNHNVHAFSDRNDVGVDQNTQQTNINSNSKGYLYYYSSYAGLGGSGDAILYWDETLATDSVKIIASSVKSNPCTTAADSVYSFAQGNGKWYGIANSTWPSVAIDSAGTMYLVYSSFTLNDDDGAGNYFRDIYVQYSTDNGKSWSNPINVTSGLGFNVEQIYPSVARNADANIHITYLNKLHPGNDQNNSSPEVYNIYDLSVSTADIKSNTTGAINGVAQVKNDVFSMDQNFPNPCRGITSIPVKLNMSTDVTINIVSLVGQNVYSHKFEKATSGVNNFQVDLSNLNSGVYFYTVEAEGYKITKRMMVD
jgi:Secretion system C-terminal sorting domain